MLQKVFLFSWLESFQFCTLSRDVSFGVSLPFLFIYLFIYLFLAYMSPKGEVNGYIETRRVGVYYLALYTDADGDSSFSIYQISWIKMKL